MTDDPSLTPQPGTPPPIFTLIAAAILVLCLFTPVLLITLPIMVTVGLAIVGAYRGERPRWLPFLVGGLAVLLVVLAQSNFRAAFATRPTALSNADAFKDAKWDYGSAEDAMRGTTSKWATINSPSEVNLPSPYDGDNVATLEVAGGGGVILSVTKGQFLCHSDGYVSIKFDGGPIYTYPCSTPDSGNTETLYINSAYSPEKGQSADPLDGIAKAKSIIIEAPFFDAGTRQFTFHVEGLDRTKL
jgi:hypothetical protein